MAQTAIVHDGIARAVFVAVIICWTLFGLIFSRRRKTPKASEQKRERTSYAGIGLQMAGYALAWIMHRAYFSAIAPMAAPAEIAMAVFTVGVGAGSLWLVYSAVQTLGRQWAYAARIIEGHRLITEGPYRAIRNPIYTGMFGMLVASGLAVSSGIGLLAGAIIFLIGSRIRIRSEEKLLRESFGQEFQEYARRVPSMFPWISSARRRAP